MFIRTHIGVAGPVSTYWSVLFGLYKWTAIFSYVSHSVEVSHGSLCGFLSLEEKDISNNEMCVRCVQTHGRLDALNCKNAFYDGAPRTRRKLLPTPSQAQPSSPPRTKRNPPFHHAADARSRFPVFSNASLFSHAYTIPDIVS